MYYEGWSFLINRQGALEFWYASKDLYWEWMQSSKLEKGKWYMDLATVQDSRVCFYMNGKLISQQNKDYTPVDNQNFNKYAKKSLISLKYMY